MAEPNNEHKRRHVALRPSGGRRVVAPGAERASARSVIQREAEVVARRMVTSLGGGEATHRPDGRIASTTPLATEATRFCSRDYR